jgi:hypothetical protein
MELVGSGYFNEVIPPNTGNAASFTLSVGSVTATEVKASTNRLTDRRGVFIKNRSTVAILWGFSNSTAYNPLEGESASGAGNGGSIFIEVGDKQAVYVIAASGSGNTVSGAELK